MEPYGASCFIQSGGTGRSQLRDLKGTQKGHRLCVCVRPRFYCGLCLKWVVHTSMQPFIRLAAVLETSLRLHKGWGGERMALGERVDTQLI